MVAASPSNGIHKPAKLVLEDVVRPNVLKLQPYRCARDDYSEGVLLDANENALGHSISASTSATPIDDFDSLDLNRYPDPAQMELKSRIAKLRNIEAGAPALFLGIGSDEACDLIMRCTCVPGIDQVLVCPPTYGMYSVCANMNDVGITKIPLVTKGGSFLPDTDAIMHALSTLSPPPKLVFLTSPGNPTGTCIPIADLRRIAEHPTWRGLIIADEAYMDFADPDNRGDKSAIQLINEGYENIIVMQTLSKGFGLAGIRLGYAVSAPAFSQILANAKMPYNIPSPTASLALRALEPSSLSVYSGKVHTLVRNRRLLLDGLARLAGMGRPLGANEANFVLVPVLARDGSGRADSARAQAIYKSMAEHRGVVVRYRGNELGCEGCLRITVGSEAEVGVALERLAEALAEL